MHVIIMHLYRITVTCCSSNIFQALVCQLSQAKSGGRDWKNHRGANQSLGLFQTLAHHLVDPLVILRSLDRERIRMVSLKITMARQLKQTMHVILYACFPNWLMPKVVHPWQRILYAKACTCTSSRYRLGSWTFYCHQKWSHMARPHLTKRPLFVPNHQEWVTFDLKECIAFLTLKGCHIKYTPVKWSENHGFGIRKMVIRIRGHAIYFHSNISGSVMLQLCSSKLTPTSGSS